MEKVESNHEIPSFKKHIFMSLIFHYFVSVGFKENPEEHIAKQLAFSEQILRHNDLCGESKRGQNILRPSSLAHKYKV